MFEESLFCMPRDSTISLLMQRLSGRFIPADLRPIPHGNERAGGHFVLRCKYTRAVPIDRQIELLISENRLLVEISIFDRPAV